MRPTAWWKRLSAAAAKRSLCALMSAARTKWRRCSPKCGSDQDADQSRRGGNAGGGNRVVEVDPRRTCRRAGRHCAHRGLAGVRRVGLRHRDDIIRRWRDDALSGIRDGRLTVGRGGLHHALRIVLKKLAGGGGEKLLFLREQLRLVRGGEKRMGAFHFSILDEQDEVVGRDRRMPQLRFL